jgi:hypothetical protein
MTGYTAEEIARVVHEAARALQAVQGDPVPAPPWAEARPQMRATAVESVRRVMDGADPEANHAQWCEQMTRDGWTWGVLKDPLARTHPCLVPYADLPGHQRDKDELFVAIVRALTDPALT